MLSFLTDSVCLRISVFFKCVCVCALFTKIIINGHSLLLRNNEIFLFPFSFFVFHHREGTIFDMTG